ncbi:MAG: hypothetical protein Q4E71_07605, partial [Prevotella sp.]|nr:hypothetical protein [Prevotella sp.]
RGGKISESPHSRGLKNGILNYKLSVLPYYKAAEQLFRPPEHLKNMKTADVPRPFDCQVGEKRYLCDV